MKVAERLMQLSIDYVTIGTARLPDDGGLVHTVGYSHATTSSCSPLFEGVRDSPHVLRSVS